MTGLLAQRQEKAVLQKIVMIPGYSACLFVPIDKDFLTSSCLFLLRISELSATTVDGGNPANQFEVGSLSHYLQGFCTIPGGFLAGFLNHQQYVYPRCRLLLLDVCVFSPPGRAQNTLHQPSWGSGLGFANSWFGDHHNSMNGEEAIDWKLYDIYLYIYIYT